MAQFKQGKQSIVFPNRPTVSAWASVAGKRESEGPLSDYFDICSKDSYFGQSTWEQAEKFMQQLALEKACKKAGFSKKELDWVFSGDLLNQCIGSSFSLRNQSIPHLGLYGACSTMAESLILAGMAVNAGFADHIVAMTSSHFASSERQYRFPLGYGCQRTPTAQWTVTGSGAAIISAEGKGPKLESATIGTVTDLGITDANNMGAAMAPAACQTICAHLNDLGAVPEDFDWIVTGDLGELGRDMLLELLDERGLDLSEKLMDCGMLIFDSKKQDVHAGGSGCGCSAITLCGFLLNRLQAGSLKRILFCGTGALLSPVSVGQKLPIPGVCHAVSILGGA